MTDDQEVITAADFTTADEFVPEICAGLDVSGTVAQRASNLARRYDGLEQPTINRQPRTIAAGAVYYASLLENRKVTQEEVANAAARGKVSIRRAYHEICEYEEFDRGKKEAEAASDESRAGVFSYDTEESGDESADCAAVILGLESFLLPYIVKTGVGLLVVLGVANLVSALAGPVTAVTPAFERAAETALAPELIMLAALVAVVSGAVVVALSVLLPRRRYA